MYFLTGMIHIGGPLKVIAILVARQAERGLGIKRFRAQFLLMLTVYKQVGRNVVALDGERHLLAHGNTVVESVEVTVAGKTEFTGARIGKVEHGIVGAEEFRTLFLGSPFTVNVTV